MSTPLTILVIGATGTQGNAVIRALLATPSLPSIRILALTRSPNSSRSISLATLDSRITLLTGDPSSPESIFTSSPFKIDSVFCVTVHGPPGHEENQAKGLINASISHGVKHFVFSSADRGGEKVSNYTETPVAHIASKHRIELYLKEVCREEKMRWTILRPVTFMDNLTPDFAGKGFAAMWRQVGKKPVQLVAASDIGKFAAKALLHPQEWWGRQVGIAGDELNYEQACEVFKKSIGVEMPGTFCAVGSMLKLAMKDIGEMFKWFEKEGYEVDIKEARQEVPELMDFGTWLVRESGFKDLKK